MTATSIPGPDARRCLDCSAIYAYSATCPLCLSAASWPEDAWLERKETHLRLERIGNFWEMWRESE